MTTSHPSGCDLEGCFVVVGNIVLLLSWWA